MARTGSGVRQPAWQMGGAVLQIVRTIEFGDEAEGSYEQVCYLVVR